jgi:hypothetical protein
MGPKLEINSSNKEAQLVIKGIDIFFMKLVALAFKLGIACAADSICYL